MYNTHLSLNSFIEENNPIVKTMTGQNRQDRLCAIQIRVCKFYTTMFLKIKIYHVWPGANRYLERSIAVEDEQTNFPIRKNQWAKCGENPSLVRTSYSFPSLITRFCFSKTHNPCPFLIGGPS